MDAAGTRGIGDGERIPLVGGALVNDVYLAVSVCS